MFTAKCGQMPESATKTRFSCIITAPDLVKCVSICLAWITPKEPLVKIPVLGLAVLIRLSRKLAGRVVVIVLTMRERTNLTQSVTTCPKNVDQQVTRRKSVTKRVDGEIGCLKSVRKLANIAFLDILEKSSKIIPITRTTLVPLQPNPYLPLLDLLVQALLMFLLAKTTLCIRVKPMRKEANAGFGLRTCSDIVHGVAVIAVTKAYAPMTPIFTANVQNTRKPWAVIWNGCKRGVL